MIRFAVSNNTRYSTRQEADTEDRILAETVLKDYMSPDMFKFAGHIVVDTRMSPQFFIDAHDVDLREVVATLQLSGYLGKVISL